MDKNPSQIKTHFKMILIEDTDEWAECAIKDAAGRIFTAYLYDALVSVNLAELRPSYTLHPLYFVTENRLSDELDEDLRHEFAIHNDTIHMHCVSVEEHERNHEVRDLGEETVLLELDANPESMYDDELNRVVEREQCNVHSWILKPHTTKPTP